MKNRYHLLASILMLVTLPLAAQNSPVEGEEIALESQETAQYGNRRVGAGGTKHETKKCRECQDRPKVIMVPEEIAIESQKNTITPSVYPYVSEGPNITAAIEFIWWEAVLNGTGYAYNGTADGSTNVPLGLNVISGKLERPQFGFEPGFKVSMAGHFDHDGWDVTAEYTYLPSSAKDSISGTRDKGAKTFVGITTGDGVTAQMPIERGSTKWNQNFNDLTLALGRNFFISKFLTLRPHAGLMAAWISEKQNDDFTPTGGISDPRNEVFPFTINFVRDVEVNTKQSTWGLGLRGGIDTMWHITRAFAIYGDLAISTFWAHSHVRLKNIVTETIEGEFRTLNLDYSLSSILPVFETGLGLAYIAWFSENRFRLQTQVGWENQLWTDFNYLGTRQGNGSLSMQGLSLKLGLTF